MRHIIIFITLQFLSLSCSADTIRDTSYFSQLLKRKAKYIVLLPSNFHSKKMAGHKFPVLYLLHCAGCDHRSYYESYNIKSLIDSFDMIIAIPYDGTRFGWWLDSPINPRSQLSTWLTSEFKNRIDSLYPTLSDRGNTGIAGHSMGGFGALHNLATHPNIFGAAFSAKGRLDMVENGGGYRTNVILGNYTQSLQNYRAVDILSNVKKFKGINAAIKFYTGPNDRFLTENRVFDSLLTNFAIQHEYFENSEGHYSMTRKSMRIMLEFFDDFFTRKQ